MSEHFQKTSKSVTLADETLTTVAEIPTAKIESLFVEVTVSVTALDQFVIAGRPNADGAFNTLYSLAADYTSPTGILIAASGDLTALSAATGWFLIYPRGIEVLRIQVARAAGSDAPVILEAGGA